MNISKLTESLLYVGKNDLLYLRIKGNGKNFENGGELIVRYHGHVSERSDRIRLLGPCVKIKRVEIYEYNHMNMQSGADMGITSNGNRDDCIECLVVGLDNIKLLNKFPDGFLNHLDKNLPFISG
jgi:hypothetical protein